MYIVLLKFAVNRDKAGLFMEGHKNWIKRGFDDGVFILAGSLPPSFGGGIMAHNTSLTDLQDRVNQDPLVLEKIVSAEITEFTPSKADDRMSFLLPQSTAPR